MSEPTADAARWDWTLIPGDTAQPGVVELLDPDDAPYDLTGVTGVCQVRAEPGGKLLLSPTVSLVSAVAGTLTFVASAASTAGLEPQRARYALRLTWPSGFVKTVLEGDVTIRPPIVS